jgi:hypothetical protein
VIKTVCPEFTSLSPKSVFQDGTAPLRPLFASRFCQPQRRTGRDQSFDRPVFATLRFGFKGICTLQWTIRTAPTCSGISIASISNPRQGNVSTRAPLFTQ